MKLWLLLTSLMVGGCATTATFDVERDMGLYSVWAKRGQTLGDLAHLYCEQGAPRERDIMLWAIERSSYPATVYITCEGGQ